LRIPGPSSLRPRSLTHIAEDALADRSKVRLDTLGLGDREVRRERGVRGRGELRDGVERLLCGATARHRDQRGDEGHEFSAYLIQAGERAGPDELDRLCVMLRAYVRYGLENPGSYAVMFTVDRGPDAQPQPVGLNTFQVLTKQVATVLDSGTEDPEVRLLAVSLWTFLDGLVHLHASRPHFPWPDLDHQIDYTTRLLLTAANQQRRRQH
jgi:hypothetical protein